MGKGSAGGGVGRKRDNGGLPGDEGTGAGSCAAVADSVAYIPLTVCAGFITADFCLACAVSIAPSWGTS